jgi:hypothetical protein
MIRFWSLLQKRNVFLKILILGTFLGLFFNLFWFTLIRLSIWLMPRDNVEIVDLQSYFSHFFGLSGFALMAGMFFICGYFCAVSIIAAIRCFPLRFK